MAIDLPPDLPSLETLRHILDRLKANDITWFKDQFSQGKFAWLKGRLPNGEFEKIETRVQAGDLSPLKGALSSVDLPGMDLFKGIGGIAAGVGAGGVGAAAGAAAMAGKSAVDLKDDGKKKGKGLLWLLPAVVAIAFLGWLLPRCGGSSSAPVEDTEVVEDSVAVEETIALDTTVAAVETVPAETVTAETSIAPTTVAAAAAAPGDLLSVAGAAGSFNTLAAAVNAAGLTETLQGAGPFTVFAPTDAAFAALPAGLVEALLKPENKDALTKILTYHVVSGKVLAADVVAGPVKTVEGSEFVISTDGGVKLNGDTTVTATDIAASNGVIHVIDKVLVPKSVDVAALLAGSAPAAVEPAAVAVPENLTVYFANGSSLVDDAAQDKLEGAITVLKALPAGSKVTIVGHASAKGNAAKNKALSIERAENVKGQLIAGLADAASNVTFSVDAVGDTQPDADEAKSRKVTIEIQP